MHALGLSEVSASRWDILLHKTAYLYPSAIRGTANSIPDVDTYMAGEKAAVLYDNWEVTFNWRRVRVSPETLLSLSSSSLVFQRNAQTGRTTDEQDAALSPPEIWGHTR